MESFLFKSDKITFEYLGGNEVGVDHENGLSFTISRVDIVRESRVTYEIDKSIITCGFDGDKEPYFDAIPLVDAKFDSYLWDFLQDTPIFERWDNEQDEQHKYMSRIGSKGWEKIDRDCM